MEGVSTSTAGFIGVTEKGPKDGAPVLVTNFADFRRTFGGYLSELEFGEYRFLAYSVNQFFANGGSRCYIKRVVPADAAYAASTEAVDSAPVVFYAKDPGAWGNKVTVKVAPSSKFKTQILAIVPTANTVKYQVKNSSGFSEGDVVAFLDGEKRVETVVTSIDGDFITLSDALDETAVDTALVPSKVLCTLEADIEIAYDGQIEKYEFVSLNTNTPDYISQKLAKSELAVVAVSAPEKPVSSKHRI